MTQPSSLSSNPQQLPLPERPLEVAVAQLNSQDGVDENLKTIGELAARAAQQGVRFLALPEACLSLGAPELQPVIAEAPPAAGELPKSPLLGRLAELAKVHQLWLAVGSLPLASNDPRRPHNAQVVFRPDGTVAAIYRKIHLFDVQLADGTSLRESDNSTPGVPAEDVVVVDVDGFRIGLSICYDIRFPELFRKHVDAGAHAILVPAAFTVPTGKDHWHVLLRARAIESQAYVLAAAQWGRHPRGRLTYGKSLIADPWGDVIAQASDGVGLARATLDPQRLRDVRTQLPSLTHRRLG